MSNLSAFFYPSYQIFCPCAWYFLSTLELAYMEKVFLAFSRWSMNRGKPRSHIIRINCSHEKIATGIPPSRGNVFPYEHIFSVKRENDFCLQRSHGRSFPSKTGKCLHTVKIRLSPLLSPIRSFLTSKPPTLE